MPLLLSPKLSFKSPPLPLLPYIYKHHSPTIIMSTSLSINPALSPTCFSHSTSTSSSYLPSSSSTSSILRYRTDFGKSRAHSICLACINLQYLQFQTRISKSSAKFKGNAFRQRTLFSANNNMTITDYREEEEEESPPPLLESEMNSRPRRIALFVEPSPFS